MHTKPVTYKQLTRLVLTGLCLVLFSAKAYIGAQTPTNQDCLGAIPICDWTFQSTGISPGSGNIPNEINSSISCLGTGEMNSVWYIFTTQTAGDVNFTITPNGNEDFDWAVFNLSSASCSDIFNDPSLLVACNFSPFPGPTGANGGPIPQNTAPIPVQAGEIYALIITVFQPQGQTGYSLDFTASSSQIFDNEAPYLLNVQEPIRCNTDTLTVRFNENVSCTDITTGSFTVAGPAGNHTVTGIYSADCAAGASQSSAYTLTLSPPLTANGQYSITLNNNVNDLCGNTAPPGTNITFNYAGLIVDSTFSTLADCLVNNGTAGIAISGGVLPLSYSWLPSGQTTPVATNLFAGNYNVTVTDQNNCTVTETVTVSNPINFAISYLQIPDTCQKGNGTVTAIANGSSGPFTYEWINPAAAIGEQTLSQLNGNDSLVVSVTDVDGCVLFDTVLVENITNDSIVSIFSATPNPVDILFPVTKLINESENFSTYKWVIMGETITNVQNPVVTLPDWGNYPVELMVYDINGCADTSVQTIRVRGDLYYYIPNAFTPDENFLNETWYPRGVGFNDKTLQITIFDRWENIVYMSKDPDQGWNGLDLKGQPCPGGMYIYKIMMEGYEGALPVFTGHLTLIR